MLDLKKVLLWDVPVLFHGRDVEFGGRVMR